MQPPESAPQSPARRHRLRDRLGWKFWSGLGLAILVIAGSTTYLAGQAARRAGLMRTDPDAVVANHELVRFASAYAQPAYDEHCASCHGDRLQGDHRNGVPDLTHPAWLYGE